MALALTHALFALSAWTRKPEAVAESAPGIIRARAGQSTVTP